MKSATGVEKEQLRLNLRGYYLQKADALDQIRKSQEQANKAAEAFNNWLSAGVSVGDENAKRVSTINQLLRERARLARIPEPTQKGAFPTLDAEWANAQARIREIDQKLPTLRNQVFDLSKGFSDAFAEMAQSWMDNVQIMQDVKLLPKKITPEMKGQLLYLQTQIGRGLTVKEMELAFKFLIDPKAKNKLSTQLKNLLRDIVKETTVEIKPKVKLARHKLNLQEAVFGRTKLTPSAELQAKLKTNQAKTEADKFLELINGMKPVFNAQLKPGTDAARRKGVESGNAFAEGIVQGFGEVNLSRTINITINKHINTINKEFGNQSPSKVWARTVGRPFGEGVLLGIIKGLDNIKDVIKQIRQVQRKLRKALKAGNKEVIKELRQELRDLKKEMREGIAQARKDAIENAAQMMLDTFKGFRDDLRSMFFTGLNDMQRMLLDWGVTLSVPDLTKGLREQTAKLQDFINDWNNLMSRGVPPELLMQLREMGEEGVAIIDALAAGTDVDVSGYVAAWQEAQQLITQGSNTLMDTQLAIWRKMGTELMLGFLAGLKDEEEGLLKYFRKLFKQMLKEEKKSNKSGSPSRVYREEGRNIMAGLKQGLMDTNVVVPTPRMGTMSSLAGGAAGGTTVNMVIHAHHDETLWATMQKATFRLRNRR